MTISQTFRGFSWILLLVSAFLVTYSGLFFVGVSPLPPVKRFWEGGAMTLLMAGTLDLIGGVGVFIIIGALARRGLLRFRADIADLRIYYKSLTVCCMLGLIGDLIGGLYGIGAQIGLYTTIINWLTS